MWSYLLNKIVYGSLVISGVIIIVFYIFHALPGDPMLLLQGQRTDVSTKDVILRELGLDKPLPMQLLYYFGDLSPISFHKHIPENIEKYHYIMLTKLPGNRVLVLKWPYLRRSFQTNKRVSEILKEHLEGTFWLAFFSMALATFFGVGAGVLSALKQNSWLDHLLVSLTVFGVSVPTFVIAILVAMIFGYYLSEYTGLNITGQLWTLDSVHGKQLQIKNIILPGITLALRPLAVITQLTRSSMLDVLNQDYIRTAKAKGLPMRMIIWKHALKNALNPVITTVSGWLASLLAGAFFIEYIFNWKGIGTITIKAVENLDFPVVMGSTIAIAFFFVIINIAVDILYVWIDPRVRLQ